MEKRAILAIVLSVAVIIIFQMFFTPKIPLQPIKQPEQTKQQETDKPLTQSAPDNQQAVEKLPPTKPALTLKGRDIVVETDVMKLVFTTVGARLKQWELKKYKIEDKPAELVTAHAEAMPFSINFDNINDSSVNYESDTENLDITKCDEGTISFHGKLQNGIEILKTYSFKRKEYTVSLSVDLTNTSSAALTFKGMECTWGPDFGVIKKPEEIDTIEPKTLIGESVIKDKVKTVRTAKAIHSGAINWTALQAKQFVVAIVSQESSIAGSSFSYEKGFLEMSALTNSFSLAPKESKTIKFIVYGGPQTYEDLRKVGVQLEKILHFGWFSGLGLILLLTLTFFYNLSHNYGIAIIFLTIVVKIILWWPSQKSYKSMKAMQVLAPQIEALKQRYKNNPQQLNQEMLRLYRENKVNPLGGCLPMVLQIPIFFGLYSVLVSAAELQGAPFAFWIKDLSKMDPYYVLPILMGITMFIQQKMTPVTDPNQAKIMLIMPIVFTFMFVSLPSGVVLYWTVQNVLSIAQQYWTQKS